MSSHSENKETSLESEKEIFLPVRELLGVQKNMGLGLQINHARNAYVGSGKIPEKNNSGEVKLETLEITLVWREGVKIFTTQRFSEIQVRDLQLQKLHAHKKHCCITM